MAELVRLDVHHDRLAALTRSEPFARDLMVRGQRVSGLAKDLCPVDTGRLRSSIDHRLVMEDQGLAVYIGTDVWYARMVHGGTRAHIIERRGPLLNSSGRVRTLRFRGSGGGFVFVRMVHHPGTTGVRFLELALPAAA